MPLEPTHKPQKKKKLVTHFPNGMPIPKPMQYMVDKGLKLVESDHLHNCLIEAAEKDDDAKGGPMLTEAEYELYWINNSVFIIDQGANEVWLTKDSDPSDLTPEYWNNLVKENSKDIK